MWIRNRSTLAADRPRWVWGPSSGPLLVLATLIPAAAGAVTLDFGGALQDLEAGKKVRSVTLSNGATMEVRCETEGRGPDVCIIFDSAEPGDHDEDLGTPNEDFGGPGEGDGGERGEEGKNDAALGNLLIIAENVVDSDRDGFVDEPESEGGTVWLRFSHAGRLSLALVDVDRREEEPVLKLYRDGNVVKTVEGESLGDNSVQHLDLSRYGNVDAVRIELDSSAGIAAIQLEIEVVGIEADSWSNVKALFR